MILREKWHLPAGQGVAVPIPGCCDQALVTPVYWHEGGGGVSPGFGVSFRFRLVGMRGAADGDHEGNLALTGLRLSC